MTPFTTTLLSVLFIDIETVSQKSNFTLLSEPMKKAWAHKASFSSPELPPEIAYFNRAGIYAEFGKVVAISVGFFYLEEDDLLKFKVKCLFGHDERELLLAFNALVEKRKLNRKPIFCAHNGKEFDYPYLGRRFLLNNLELPRPLRLMGLKPWEVDHLDTLDLWKFGDRKNYTSLDLLATIFEIPSSKNDLDGSKVNEMYYRENDIERIAQYCNEDVVVTAQLYLKLHNKPLIEYCNITYLFDRK